MTVNKITVSQDVLSVAIDIINGNITQNTISICNSSSDENWNKYSILRKVSGANLETANKTTYFKEELIKEIPDIKQQVQYWLLISFYGTPF
jgi:hypothetical protein